MEIEGADPEKSYEQLSVENAEFKKQIKELESLPKEHKKDLNYFKARLTEEIARSTRYQYEFSILLISLDNMADYASKCGESAAAEILGMLDLVLNSTLRTPDLKCDFGDAQYGVILPYTDNEGGRITAEKLRQSVERTFTLKGSAAKISLTLSCSIASYPKNAVTDEQLMMLSMEALNNARISGGNCVCMAEETAGCKDLEKKVRLRLQHNDSFIRALEEEVSRCSRYRLTFSLLLLSITSLETKDSGLPAAIRDEILRAVYGLLNINLRNVDKCYLYTNSRFVVILPHNEMEGCSVIARKLIQILTCNPVVRIEGKEINIKVNIGISVFPIDAVAPEGLLWNAEYALNEAIQKGENVIELASFISGSSNKNGREINQLIAILKEAGPSSIYNLLAAVDVTDNYIRPHSQSVAKYAVLIGRELGLSTITSKRLRTMALLHDLGKACLPESIVRKPESLSGREWERMMEHPQLCFDMLKEFTEFKFCCLPVLSHHERPDGKGYPKGLKREQIPMESKIIAVAEAYDDMVTPRPYRQQVSSLEAIEELKKCSGTQFDPTVVKAFIKALSIK